MTSLRGEGFILLTRCNIFKVGVPPPFWQVKKIYFYLWYELETLQVVRLAFLGSILTSILIILQNFATSSCLGVACPKIEVLVSNIYPITLHWSACAPKQKYWIFKFFKIEFWTFSGACALKWIVLRSYVRAFSMDIEFFDGLQFPSW